MSTQPHTDVAALALDLLRAGQSTAEIRTVLRDQHGLTGSKAGRIVQRAQMELATPPEAVAAAETLLRDGRGVEEAIAAVRERFSLGGWAAHRVTDAAVAELIGDFELGAVDAYLSAAMGQVNDRGLSAAERGKNEARLAAVFAAYDTLTDCDATARETITAAAKLDKLLSLGWRQRLPKGAFDSAAKG